MLGLAARQPPLGGPTGEEKAGGMFRPVQKQAPGRTSRASEDIPSACSRGCAYFIDVQGRLASNVAALISDPSTVLHHIYTHTHTSLMFMRMSNTHRERERETRVCCRASPAACAGGPAGRASARSPSLSLGGTTGLTLPV